MKIIVYSSPNCGSCLQLKKDLDDKNISYENKDVQNEPESYKELVGAGYHSVPVIKIMDDANIPLFFNIVDYESKDLVFKIIEGEIKDE